MKKIGILGKVHLAKLQDIVAQVHEMKLILVTNTTVGITFISF